MLAFLNNEKCLPCKNDFELISKVIIMESVTYICVWKFYKKKYKYTKQYNLIQFLHIQPLTFTFQSFEND